MFFCGSAIEKVMLKNLESLRWIVFHLLFFFFSAHAEKIYKKTETGRIQNSVSPTAGRVITLISGVWLVISKCWRIRVSGPVVIYKKYRLWQSVLFYI